VSCEEAAEAKEEEVEMECAMASYLAMAYGGVCVFGAACVNGSWVDGGRGRVCMDSCNQTRHTYLHTNT